MFRRLAAILCTALLFGPALATTYPLEVVDELGHTLTLTRAPSRVISMLPSHTEAICAIGACGTLVAVDRHSNYPAAVAGLPNLGDAFAADLEALVALQPDLVIVDEYSGLQAPLEKLGIPVFAGSPQTIEETYAFFATLGAMLDREAGAAALTRSLREDLAAVTAAVAGATEPAVFVELDPTPYSVGPGSYIGELVAAAGGANIVTAAMGDFPQVDPEYVVLQDPDVIVLTDAPFGVTAAGVASRPGWSDLSAVRSGRVYELDSETADALSRPGPRLAEAVRLLAGLFHPDAF